MPRTPRLDYPGARHHVMNRGARRAPIFLTDGICVLFLQVLAAAARIYGVRVHGYALMPNHYHLMLEAPRGNLAEMMRHVGGVFTQRLNAQEGWDGPVFRGRYTNRVVESDAYWMHLLAYLHLNPVKAGLATRPEDCVWTSHAAYVGKASRPDWLTCDALLGQFGSAKAFATYVRDLRTNRRAPPDDFDPDALWRAPATAAVPAEAPAMIGAEEALAAVARITGVAPSALRERARTPSGNPAWWLAAWWLGRATPMSQADIAHAFGVTRPRISQLRRQLLRRAAKDPAVAAWMRTLEAEAR